MNKELTFDDYHWAIDIPKVESNGEPSESWYCVEYFKTREAALAYAKEYFGADEDGKICLLSKI